MQYMAKFLLPCRPFAKPGIGGGGAGNKKNTGTGYDALTFVNYMIPVSPLLQVPADLVVNRRQRKSAHGIL